MSGHVKLSSRFDEALLFASELHREQRRKGNDTPYLAHLLAAAATVLDNGADEDTAIGALLHDAVEDQGGPETLAVIRQRFGERVSRIVVECSDNEGEPKRAWIDRKRDFVESVGTLSPEARMVAMADKLHNVRTLAADYRRSGEELWTRFNGHRDGTLWYYRAFVEAMCRSGSEPLIRELAEAVNEFFELVGAPRFEPWRG